MAINRSWTFFMKIEDEIKTTKFRNPFHKMAVNLLFTASWLEERNRQYFKPYEVTPQQFNLLRILRGQHPSKISVAEIKSRMIDKNSDTSRLVSRLLSKKMIEKEQSSKDKRAADIRITEEGLRLLKRIDTNMDQTDAGLFKLTCDEAIQLSLLLDKTRG